MPGASCPIFCRFPIPTKHWQSSAPTSIVCRTRSVADPGRKPFDVSALCGSAPARGRNSSRAGRTHRLRRAARRQQCLRQREQPAHGCPGVAASGSLTHDAATRRRIASRRPRRVAAEQADFAADRRSWRSEFAMPCGRSTNRRWRALGARPTLIEWDTRLAAVSVLQAEAARAQSRLDACERLRYARAS